MPSSDHLRPRLNREILGRVLLFLWFRSIGTAKSDPNLCANSVNLFLREPLAKPKDPFFFLSTQLFFRSGGHQMECPKCHSDNETGAKFCNECGAKLEIACPECGKTNRPGSKFCNECGHDLIFLHNMQREILL